MKPQLNTPLAISYMLVAMAFIPLIDVFAKFLGQQGLPLWQVVWGRFFFASLTTLPFALRAEGPGVLWPSHPLLQTTRAVFLLSSTAFFFGALRYLPIADTLAIFFIQPLVITALSPFVLGEKVGARRWAMVCLGFVGVLIIIRPGLKEFNLGVLLALGAGVMAACYMLLTRKMAGRVSATVTSFQTSLIGAIALSAAMPQVWQAPSTSQWMLLAGIGTVAVGCHFFITKAYDHAEASLLSPFAFTEMVTAVLMGWWFFGDFPDAYTFLGVAILISCAVMISWRERQLKKQLPTID
jgi:drug/metabolite transporter (DMT)-like permease